MTDEQEECQHEFVVYLVDLAVEGEELLCTECGVTLENPAHSV